MSIYYDTHMLNKEYKSRKQINKSVNFSYIYFKTKSCTYHKRPYIFGYLERIGRRTSPSTDTAHNPVRLHYNIAYFYKPVHIRRYLLKYIRNIWIETQLDSWLHWTHTTGRIIKILNDVWRHEQDFLSDLLAIHSWPQSQIKYIYRPIATRIQWCDHYDQAF